ncbi:MAG: hypothetical protein NW205_13630 [Hyphomicrobiaceae bacterium]|nr:hypothetical protein [Hyphomicrobiaceae bacterium]
MDDTPLSPAAADRRSAGPAASQGEVPSSTATGGEIPFIERPETIRWLRFAVVAMGVVLIAGLGVVIARIAYLVSQSPTTGVPSPRPAVAVPGDGAPAGAAVLAAHPSAAPTARILLPRDAEIKSVSMSGDRLVITYEDFVGGGLLIVDAASGQRLQHFVFDRAPAP